MTNLKVSPDDLIKTSSDLSDLSGALKECFDKITTSIDKIRENWKDANGIEFSHRYENEVKPKLSAYYDAIMEHSKFIKGASDIYQETIGTIHSSVA